MLNIPWCEKYRPTQIDNIVLSNVNRKILSNMIKGTFENVLFYGPPGSGKTTTIIQSIKEYQREHNYYGEETIIHLNASDERGIETIRQQIINFSKCGLMFGHGDKFIILDEVDYMTYQAQELLSIVMMTYTNIKYCLICNYPNKINETIKQMCIPFLFNKHPKEKIYMLLKNIATSENITISKDYLYYIIELYEFCDIRSMINHLQEYSYEIKEVITNKNVYNNIFWNALFLEFIEIYEELNSKDNQLQLLNNWLNKCPEEFEWEHIVEKCIISYIEECKEPLPAEKMTSIINYLVKLKE
jgi:replication factor C subunit 3/5